MGLERVGEGLRHPLHVIAEWRVHGMGNLSEFRVPPQASLDKLSTFFSFLHRPLLPFPGLSSITLVSELWLVWITNSTGKFSVPLIPVARHLVRSLLFPVTRCVILLYRQVLDRAE